MTLGKSISEIEELPERELKLYELYYEKQPFGLWRDDYRHAQLCLTAVQLMDNKSNITLNDFMYFYNKNLVKNQRLNSDGIDDYINSIRS